MKLNQSNQSQNQNLKHNFIESIEDNTFKLNKLKILDLSNNKVHYVNNQTLWGLNDLKEINLSGNLIESIESKV